MKGAVVVAMALAAAMIVGVAGDSTNPLCDPTYECQFKVTTADNSQYTYDLSGLCSDSQWVLHDAKRHTYYANICGYAKQNCLPLGWTNNYEMGVTVQMWGAPPAGGCQNRCTSHASGTAQPACCTADCQVLGREEPHWSLLDPSNPQTGGVIAAFKGASPKDSDPFWCQFNPATGAQYEREVHYHFLCDEDVDTVQPVSAQQNSTNDCRYTIVWRTSAACAGGGGLGGGWIFILIVLGIVFIYVVGGVIFMYVTTKELTFPNCEFWTYFFELVREGFLFVGHGCKKSGGGAATAGSYDDIGASAGGASASFQGSTASYQPATGGDASPKRDYTDL